MLNLDFHPAADISCRFRPQPVPIAFCGDEPADNRSPDGVRALGRRVLTGIASIFKTRHRSSSIRSEQAPGSRIIQHLSAGDHV